MADAVKGFCRLFYVRQKGAFLSLFIALVVLMEYIVHYELQVSIVYTHLYYLIIIIAAIWYQKKAVFVAIFLGLLHILVTYSIMGTLYPEAVIRAVMFCIVAFIVGALVGCLNLFREELVRQNEEQSKTQAAYLTANKKLNLLSSITRHDILNQLTALLGYLELSKEICTDPQLLDMMDKEQRAADAIRKQIEFTRHYQDIGVKSPEWHDLQSIFDRLQSAFHHETITLVSDLAPTGIYADPLFPLLCQNLIDNSVRHGETVTTIRFSTEQKQNSLLFVYEDNGTGIPDTDKVKIFERGYGKNTGMGLFLAQEILAITGLSMRETGIYHKGARFEIDIPDGSYRVISGTDKT